MCKRFSIVLSLLLGFMYIVNGQKVLDFVYWGDNRTAKVEIQYWVEMDGQRTKLDQKNATISPSKIDQDIRVLVEYKNVEYGFRDGKKRFKDHHKYFSLLFPPNPQFNGSNSEWVQPEFTKNYVIDQSTSMVIIPFSVMANTQSEQLVTLRTGFLIQHTEFNDEKKTEITNFSFKILPNAALIEMQGKQEKLRALYVELSNSYMTWPDQKVVNVCEQIINYGSKVLNNTEMQDVRSILKETKDELPEYTEDQLYNLVANDIQNGLFDDMVGHAKKYLRHFSRKQYKGKYRQEILYALINYGKNADEQLQFIEIYKQQYPNGKYVDQLASAARKIRSARGRSMGGFSEFDPSMNASNSTPGKSDKSIEESPKSEPDTTTADMKFDVDQQSIDISITGTSNALMMRLVDRITKKGWNKILPPDKLTYEVNIWADQEFEQLESGLYAVNLMKVLPDTSYKIANQVLITLDKPRKIPKVTYYIGALGVFFMLYGFYQKYLKL